MTDTLLPYYSSELAYIRTMASEFARVHPAMAERLGLSDTPGQAKDPHVERLIEAFAYLTGRIRRKLDDDFPELVNGLMDALYPHYQCPIPSMAIAQITMSASQSELSSGYPVPAGTEMEANLNTGCHAGEKCTFRTAYPVTAFPIEVTLAQLSSLPMGASEPRNIQAEKSLRISLRCLSEEMTFAKLPLRTLRFYLAGQDQHALALYELIFNHTVEVMLKSADSAGTSVILGCASLKEVGFGKDEMVLPCLRAPFPDINSFSEYFAFPRKFLFLDIVLEPEHLAQMENQIELHLFLDRSSSDLEKVVNAEMFRLGCTPIVNLFKRRAELIDLDETKTEYRVVPDRRRPLAHEIYSVDSVTMTMTGRSTHPVACRPFFSFTHAASESGTPDVFWCARRRSPRRDRLNDGGTEMYLSLVDLGFTPLQTGDRVLSADIMCLNRDLPAHLPWGGGQPKFTLIGGGPVSVECLTKPTHTLRPDRDRGAIWRLISHLSLNYLSLGYGEDASDELREQAAEALREILRLYDHTASSDSRAKISGIVSLTAQTVIRRFSGSAGGACRGLKVTIRLDEERFSDRGLYLFASVLERFLPLYCSINSFVELVAIRRQSNGVLRHWRPRGGEQVLL